MPDQNSAFAGKVAFVTGAANGVGRAAALTFARKGASVAVADLSEDGIGEVVKLIEAVGGTAMAIRCDVSRGEEVRVALDKTRIAWASDDIILNRPALSRWHPEYTEAFAASMHQPSITKDSS